MHDSSQGIHTFFLFLVIRGQKGIVTGRKIIRRVQFVGATPSDQLTAQPEFAVLGLTTLIVLPAALMKFQPSFIGAKL